MWARSSQFSDVFFEPLERRHIPRLYQWRRQPHVREFYATTPLSRSEALRKYTARIDPASPTKAFLILAGRPIGYIQAYRLKDWPEYAAVVGEMQGISVDLFIGEADHIGCGWGPVILIKFLAEIGFPIFPDQELCWISHDLKNERARKASRAAGFQPVRTIVEDGTNKELLVLTRSEACSAAQTLR